MLSPRLAALSLAALVALAGCIGKPSDDVEPLDNATNLTEEQNATLPDGRGESAGLLETNKTEEGVGGIEHKHDYWKGKDRVVLYDREVTLDCPPCMPDGEGTQPKAVAYVKLGALPSEEESGEGGNVSEAEGASAMVYEGADKVEVLIGAPSIFEPAHPAPPQVYLQWRSAADADWNEPQLVTFDTPLVIDVTPQMTDMPHSMHSLWVFRLTTDRAEPAVTVPMTVTVVKGREVVDWPGHPDFYADKDSRVVMQQHVTTHMSGIESGLLYDSGGTWANPEKLISWGTKEIYVIVNVTRAQSATGAAPTGYFIEVHNATIIGPEIRFGSRHHDIDNENDLKTYEFAILVDEMGMDGPYQPASRWGFRLMATFADVDSPAPLPEPLPQGVGLCPGCFSYDIEYDITVIAQDFESGRGVAMEPL